MSAGNLGPVMERNFLEYASYVVVDRAIPDLRDGCKPVQRRILQTLHEMDDGRKHKVANVVGETMKLHPHGDASIYDALVSLANKDFFIERQGNFGDPITGARAAAARYIECRLTPLARETLFNDHLVERKPSYDGRKDEFTWLPAKLPVVLLLGVEGIAVGMATSILPHNFGELLQAQIALLRGEAIELLPDFPQGGIVDATEYDDGRGRIRVRARIEADGDKRVVIREIPYGTTTEKLLASIEAAERKGKVKIGAITDFTAEQVEIEIQLPRGIYADEVIPQLYAYTDCEKQHRSDILVIDGRRPVKMTVSQLLHGLTVQLRATIKRELEWELAQLESKHHWLTLEQIFIEHRVYKLIEEQVTAEGVKQAVLEGMQPFTHLFIRELIDADVQRLLELRIRRISQYDINKNRKDIDDIVRAMRELRSKLKRLTQTVIAWLEDLYNRYATSYPRRSELRAFDAIDKQAVARANLKVAYDPASGYFGTEVKGSEHQQAATEFDRFLLISDDGSYRIVPPPDKMLIPGKLLYCARFDPDRGIGFVVVYRDKTRSAFGKRILIQKFINGREYELIKDRAGKLDLLLPGDATGRLHLTFAKAPRQRLTECEFDLGSLEPTAPTARGTRLAPKPVARLKLLG